MSEPQEWAFREALQPKADETQFDLARALDAMVLVRAEVPADGYTVSNLGTERGGYGAVIREDGLVLVDRLFVADRHQQSADPLRLRAGGFDEVNPRRPRPQHPPPVRAAAV